MLVAVDTGGTKTLVALFSRNGTLKKSSRFPTPKNTDEYISTLVAEIKKDVKSEEVSTISIALPGVLKDGVALWCNNLGWRNFDITSALSAHFKATILLENDANLAGLAEARVLPAPPPLSMYITYSTGIGTALILGGKIHPGLKDSEGGHAILEYNGALQDWETFASGGAVYRTFGKYGRDIHDAKTWRAISDRMSRGLLAYIPLLQPQVIIFGGSMGTHFPKYHKYLHELLKERLHPDIQVPKLIQAKHPEEAVVYGCYYHAIDQNAY